MAWVAPRTFVAGEVHTAAHHNQIRDSLNETVPAKATTAGDTFYATGVNAIVRLGMGANGRTYVAASGIPAWEAGHFWLCMDAGSNTNSTSYVDDLNTQINIDLLGLIYSALAIYFEAVIFIQNAANICSAQLYDVTGAAAITGSEVTTQSTTQVRVRSGDIRANLTAGARSYVAQVKTNDGAQQANIAAARLIAF